MNSSMRPRGYSLIDLVLTIGVIAVLIGVILVKRADGQRRVDAGIFVDELVGYSDKLRAQCVTPDFSCMTLATAISLRPSAWSANPDNATVRHRLGGDVSFEWKTVDGVANAALDITTNGVPQNICGNIATGAFPRFARITINTTAVKTSTTASLDLATASAACNSATNTIVWRLL